MGDNLHELNRKELKELCSQNNIRTAGVKHEDLVRLLRNKMYPSSPQTPRAMKGRGLKVPSPGKEDGDSYKTPVKTAGRGRSFRSSTLPREDVTASARKNMSGLSRKPLLTKSNTMSSRRTDLGMKTLGVDHDAQENFVRRLCQVNGMSPLSRKGVGATTGQSASKPSHLSLAQANGKTEDMTSPRPSEGGSEAGSDASRRVSEIATDAGPDTMSDFSDAEEFRSVSSEPISKLSSISKRNSSLRTESGKMSHLSAQSGLSFLTAGTSWGTNDHTMDNLSEIGRTDSTEVIFPEFPPEGSNFLVGDTDALDLSFLHAGAADPEVIVKGKDEKFDMMDSPMARDYVNYNRGSEADIRENSIDSNRVSIGEEPRDVNGDVAGTSIDAGDKPRDSTATIAAEDAESKEVGHITDELELPKNELALGNEGTDSKQYEPRKEDNEDGPEIHSELPCLESNSPTFDSKDYSVAKKLVFEREESLSLPPPLQDDVEGNQVNAQSNEEGPVLSVPEEEVPALHSKSDEPTEAVSETPPPTIENTSSDGGEEVNGSNFEDGPVLSVPNTLDEKDFALQSKTSEPTMNGEAVSETPPPTIENTSSDGGEEINVEEGPVLSVPEEEDPALHSKSNEPTEAISETPPPTIENTSSDGGEEVNGSNFEDGPVLSVPNTLDEKDFALQSKASEPTMNGEAVSETPPPTIENASSNGEEEVNVEGPVLPVPEEEDPALHSKSDEPTMNGEAVSETPPPTIENTSTDKGEEVNGSNFEEGPILPVPKTLDEKDFALHSKSDEPAMNIDGEGGVTSVEEFDAPAKHNDAVNEGELADTTVSSPGMDSFETEDQDTSTLERHVDMSSDSSLTKTASDKAAPELEGSPANEPEGSDVKDGNGQSASTSTTAVDYNKDEREKENKQVKLSFPLSIILWCSQVCSPGSRNRRTLTS